MFSTADRIADSRYLRMIPCARINDFNARECQEYCIDNPRMKCRGAIRCTAGYAYAYGAYRDRYLCFLLRAFPYLYDSYCKTRAEDETRNSDKRNRSLTSFGKLSGMQADSVALERNFTNISRLGKLHFARWIIVMRVKDLYCNMVYVCDCIYTWKIFARNFVTPNIP